MEISKKAIAKEHLKKEGWYDYEKGTEFKVLMQMPSLTHVEDWLGFTHWMPNKVLLIIQEEQNTSFEEDKVIHAIHRPKTRGELYQCLKNGIKCEVVASNEEFTSLALQSISITQKSDLKFKTTKSENEGWVIYELAE